MKPNTTHTLLIIVIVLLLILIIGVYMLMTNGMPNDDGSVVVTIGK